MRKKAATITAVLSLLAVGVGLFAACDSSKEEPGDVSEPYSVSWTATRGFIMDGLDRVEIETLAGKVAAPIAPSTVENGGRDFVLWALGDGISLPFNALPDDLAADQVWPDVIVPQAMVSGTHLKVFTLNEGKLDKLVTDVTFEPDLYSYEVPYATYTVTRSRCKYYCTACNNCNWCGVCNSGGGCSQNIINKWGSDNLTCDAGCGDNGCDSNGATHYCWHVKAVVSCN
jgi:hypothetical protein